MTTGQKLQACCQRCLTCRKCGIGGVILDGCCSNVFSNLNAVSRIMVVGQNPGLEEIRQGVPFVGPSGKMFNDILATYAGIKPELYITNVVRCFTPMNREPYGREVDNCREFLAEEIDILKPELVITLGGLSLTELTGLSGITKHHGKLQVSLRYGVKVLPMFHPSPRNMVDPERKKMLIEAVQSLKEIFNG